MKSARNCVYTILVKVDILDACGTICSYFGITFLIFFMKLRMLFTHLAKTFKWTYQVDPLLKNECKTCSPGTQFCKESSISIWSTRAEAGETARLCLLMTVFFFSFCFFDIMDIRNAQSHEFEQKPMLATFRSVNHRRFSWLHNVFLKSFQNWLNSVQQHQGTFTKDAGQKIFIS